MSTARLAVVCAVAIGCGDKPASDGAPPTSAPTPSAVAVPSPAASVTDEVAEDETSTRPVELLKLVFTKEVKDKGPVGQLQVASPGQKVFAHLTLRNRSGRPRKVQLAFSVGGEKRTTVELFVGDSWSWRTWAYNTVLPRDAGKKLDLEVTDDEGHPLFEGAIPIR